MQRLTKKNEGFGFSGGVNAVSQITIVIGDIIN